MVEPKAIIFDWGRTLYDPESGGLFPNTIDVLEFSRDRGLAIGLVSVALTANVEERLDDLRKYGVIQMFDEVKILPRSREPKDFSPILEKLGVKPQNSVVVGDNLKRDIVPANRIQAVPIWTKERLLADFKPENTLQVPRATIFQIGELRELIPLFEQGLV